VTNKISVRAVATASATVETMTSMITFGCKREEKISSEISDEFKQDSKKLDSHGFVCYYF
jgi:hypothetical protein